MTLTFDHQSPQAAQRDPIDNDNEQTKNKGDKNSSIRVVQVPVSQVLRDDVDAEAIMAMMDTLQMDCNNLTDYCQYLLRHLAVMVYAKKTKKYILTSYRDTNFCMNSLILSFLSFFFYFHPIRR
jgi:hypothetical protein